MSGIMLNVLGGAKAPAGSVTYTSGSGNFTVPTGIFSITYTIVGGGGGGSSGFMIGGRYNNYTYGDIVGGAGGSGGRRIDQTLAVVPGQVIAYVVGAAGQNTGGGGYGNYTGTAGGTTTFAGITATGGASGTGYNTSGDPPGGDPRLRGGGGGIGGSPGGLNGTQPLPYNGGSASIGVPQGGAGVSVNGTTYGRGGYGGPANPDQLGGLGVAGVIYISWT